MECNSNNGEVVGMAKNDNRLQPVEDKDFYTAELRRYIINIEMSVDALDETEEMDIISQAIRGFREGELDGDANIVHSDLIRKVELDFDTDLPFDRKDWEIKELKKQGLNAEGLPLRPFEKTRPESEQKIWAFVEGEK
jgi:hypothetical protein